MSNELQEDQMKNKKLKNLLIVDDEEEVLSLYRDLFSGMKIFSATGGNEAVAILRKFKIDAVVSDYNMPDGNGELVLQEANSQSIPVIVISSISDKSSLVKVTNEKPYFFFDKMAEPEEIIKKVKEAVSVKNSESYYAEIGKRASKTIHDLNGPLTLVLGNSELIRINVDKPEVVIRSLDNIEKSVDKMAAIIKRTKTEFVENVMSEEESEDSYLTPDSIVTFLMDLKKEQEAALASHKVKLNIEIPHKKDHLVFMNSLDLTRVFSNLIENSIYEFKRNNQDVRVITLSLIDEKNEVVLSYKDNGPGIPKEIRHKLFNERISTKPKGEGSGIGLDNCKTIIERHSGSIQVADRDQGAEFLMVFPIAKSEANKKAA